MNSERRKKIAEAQAHLQTAHDILEEVLDEEDNALASLPESLADSERADSMQSCIDNLDTAISDVETALESAGSIEG